MGRLMQDSEFHSALLLDCANWNVTCARQELCGRLNRQVIQHTIKEYQFKRILKSLYICSNISSVGLISTTARSTVLLTTKVKGSSSWKISCSIKKSHFKNL